MFHAPGMVLPPLAIVGSRSSAPVLCIINVNTQFITCSMRKKTAKNNSVVIYIATNQRQKLPARSVCIEIHKEKRVPRYATG